MVSSTSAPGFVLVPRRPIGRSALAAASRSPSSTSPCRATSTPASTSSTAATSTTSTTSRRSSPRRWPAGGVEAERAERLVAERGGALPRVAGLARRRAGDRLAAGARRGDPRGRAAQGRRAARPARREPATRVESVTAQIVNKLLHLPTVRMKQAARQPTGCSTPRRSGTCSVSTRTSAEARQLSSAALVGRPLPLQAPTAFVRVRPRGTSSCGQPVRRRTRCARSASAAAALGSRSRRPSSPPRACGAPGIEIALVPITTAGDRDRTKPFGQIGERGVFVKEMEEALLAGTDRRCRPLREGHDLNRYGRPRGRRVPRA